MKGYFPTYKEFSKCNDWYRLKLKRKPRNPKWLKIAYYPFILIELCFIYAAFFWLIAILAAHKKRAYRTSDKYKKVIKEGVLFTTVEYHEK